MAVWVRIIAALLAMSSFRLAQVGRTPPGGEADMGCRGRALSPAPCFPAVEQTGRCPLPSTVVHDNSVATSRRLKRVLPRRCTQLASKHQSDMRVHQESALDIMLICADASQLRIAQQREDGRVDAQRPPRHERTTQACNGVSTEHCVLRCMANVPCEKRRTEQRAV